MNLKNKIAVITGATSGVGLEIAIKLVAEGAKVYLIGRSFQGLKNELPDYKINKKIIFLYADLEKEEDIHDLIKKIEEDHIDILIHGAGVISLGLFEKEPVKSLDMQYKINVKAPFLITQNLLPKIKKVKGEILFLNSTAGNSSNINLSQYSSTKHALKVLAETLRKEMIKHKIKITTIFLGATDTPMQEKVQKFKGNKYRSDNFLDPTEISKIIIYILSLPKNINMTDLTVLPL